MKTMQLSDLGLNKEGDNTLVALPDGTFVDIQLQQGQLWLDHRDAPEADSNGCLPIDLN